MRPESLAGLIARFPVVSCDVFDTAIGRRLGRPADLHLATGARALAQGLIACTPEAFREYRLEAERALRQELARPNEGEVRVAEVYERLRACGIVSDAVAAASLEFAVERAVAAPVEPVRQALAARQPGQRLIFISDTLLPGPWITQLLSDCGYGDAFTVFTSADLRCNKYSGRLFRQVIEALGCSPADMVHIGDDPVSDIARAQENGIATLYLPRRAVPPEPDDVAGLHHLARLVHSHRRATAAGAARPEPASSGLFRHCSLLLIGYTLFVLAEARRHGIRRIFFLARDGHTPLAIARRIVASTGQSVEFSYLHVSRQSIVLPTLKGDPDRLAELIHHSLLDSPLRVALDVLGIGQAITPRMLHDFGLDPDRPVTDATTRDALRRLLHANAEMVRQQAQNQRAAALAYLEQSGFLAPGPRLVVDGGWRGSTQKALVKLTGLPAKDVIGCYLGLLPDALAPSFDPNTATGYLFSFGHPKPVMDKVLEGYGLCEFFLSAPESATTHYGLKGDRIVPILAVEPEPGGTIRSQTMTAIEARCLAEVEALDGMLGGAWPDAIDPASALFDLEPLLTRPTAQQVEEIGAIRFLGGFDSAHTLRAVNPVPLHEFLLDPGGAIRRLGHSPWRSGAVRVSLPWPLPSMTFPELRDRAQRLLNLLRLA